MNDYDKKASCLHILCIYNLSCFVEHLSVLIYTIVTGFLIVHILYFNVLVENSFFLITFTVFQFDNLGMILYLYIN